MSDQQAPLNLDQLLRSGVAAARSGNRAAARAIFLALSHEHPDDTRVWLGLAGTAADEAEQRAALERVVALDPANEQARRALERMGQPAPRITVVLPETIAQPAPPEEAPAAAAPDAPPLDAPPPEIATLDAPASARTPDEAAPRAPFPLLNLLATLLILLLLGVVGVIIGRQLLGQASTASAPTPTLVLAAPTELPLATPAPVDTAAPLATPAPIDTGATAAPPATPASAPTSAVELPLGQLIDHDGWSATLLRPDYAVSLDGAIGELQPAGRFVLAVIAISNNSPEPRQIPLDLFTLVDSAERSYTPVPEASSAYLALYERGQRGDLALEDVIEPGSGMRSVPLLFDVPPDATGLRLTMRGAAGAGWPIAGGAAAPAGP